MKSQWPDTFTELASALPYFLIDRFAGAIRPEILGHRVPALGPSASEISFSTYGVAGADAWVHEGRYRDDRPSPMLFNWKVLLGLTAHGRPYLAELIERQYVHLAALVWSVCEIALKRYNVCTYELFSRALQAAYIDHIDPPRLRPELRSYPVKTEEQPVFMYHYNKQLEDPAFFAAVKETFDCTYAPLSDSQERVAKLVGTVALPEHISMIYMNRIRGSHAPMEKYFQTAYPAPPFGPLKPGPYLYELLYANAFRYRYGGVTVLQRPVVGGKELPSALVIDFNQFIPYRAANMALYDKMRGKKRMSVYDLALTATEVFRKHYYGVTHDHSCGTYYELLAQAEPPVPPDSLMTTFVMPLPVLKMLTEQACKYGVNYLVGVSTRKKKEHTEATPMRRVVSSKSILVVNSPDTPYLNSAEFRFTHRYHSMLISPPWPLSVMDVREYYKGEEEKPPRMAVHAERTYVTLDVLRRLKTTQDYMTPELYSWLRMYDSMSKLVFMSEIKMQNQQSINKLVRTDYGTSGVVFRPEEDDAILRLYRPSMSVAEKDEIRRVCFGRSLRSISLRAGTLRHEMMSQGIYDLTKLPHGQRSESLLAAIRKAKKREARNAAKRAKEERDAAKRAAEQAVEGADVLPVQAL